MMYFCDVWLCSCEATHWLTTKYGLLYYCVQHKPRNATRIGKKEPRIKIWNN